MAKEGNLNFAMPAEFRALAEKSVEQARQAFDSIMAVAAEAASRAGRQASDAGAGARDVGALAVRFAERNIASSFDFAQQLARAKDSEEVLALHADYVKRQIAALTDQGKELSKEAAKLAGSVTQH